MLSRNKRFLLFFFSLLFSLSVAVPIASAQPNPNPFTYTQAPPSPSGAAANPGYIPISSGTFRDDDEVTFVGRNAVRTQDFLDWILTKGVTPNNRYKPIAEVWKLFMQATYAFMFIVVIAAGFFVMIRRNKDIKLKKFIPLFIGLLVYVFFSFQLTKLVYQVNESVMRIFLTLPEKKPDGSYTVITTANLLRVEFPYETFMGKRRSGPDYDESAKTSLLLVRMTNWTYMTMAGILVVRQIILWFFIILSPMLALLMPFPLIRNTGKIWIGEFFRWLFYGLLYALFLRGLVEMWRWGIPMNFIPDAPDTWYSKFPTSTNILQAGPNYVTINEPAEKAAFTSINNIDSYVNYVVALIMLWVVIILPWILLRIFRDAMNNWLSSEGGSSFMGQLGSLYSKFSPLGPGPQPAPSPPAPTPASPKSPSPAGTGRALELPFRKVNIVARDVAVNQDITNMVNIDKQITQMQTQDLSKLMNMQLPKLADIAKMEMSKQNMSQSLGNLQKLGNPNLSSTTNEMHKMQKLKSELTKRAQAGDVSAQSMLQAAQTASAISSTSAAAASGVLKGRVATVNNAKAASEQAQKATGAIAAAMASTNRAQAQRVVQQAQAATGARIMPVTNRVQTVSLEDYEEVKKMWLEHYREGAVPATNENQSKSQWLKMDIEKADIAVSMLGNINPEVKQKGLEMVAALLPFLLLGGFSEQETITYLKAKVEAAKQVLHEIEEKDKTTQEAKDKDEEESVEVGAKKKENEAQRHLEAELDDDEKKPQEPFPLDDPLQAEAIESKGAEIATTSPAVMPDTDSK